MKKKWITARKTCNKIIKISIKEKIEWRKEDTGKKSKRMRRYLMEWKNYAKKKQFW